LYALFAAVVAPFLVVAGHALWAELTDLELAQDVSSEIAADARLAGASIEVSSREGIITLTGELPDLFAKDYATEVAELVRGVRAVVNRIELKAPEVADSTPLRTVSEATSALGGNLQVSVAEGTVMLRGGVRSLRDRLWVEETVKALPGVRALDSRLTVDAAGVSDRDLEEAIRALLAWDSRIESERVSVNVEGRNVTLSGTVRSAAARTRAIRLAGLPGVESIDASKMQVKLAFETRFPLAERASGDDALGKAVQDALFYNPRVRGFRVDVDVDGGMVTLEGDVPSLRARIAAEDDAGSVSGVRGVENGLSVRPRSARADRDIENDVSLALESDPGIPRQDIVVLVLDGRVRLEGSLENGLSKTEPRSWPPPSKEWSRWRTKSTWCRRSYRARKTRAYASESNGSSVDPRSWTPPRSRCALRMARRLSSVKSRASRRSEARLARRFRAARSWS
jgi:osmotically-inducible protein OsmY